MTADKIRKIIGGVAMVGGLALSLTNDWLKNQEINKKVEEAVKKALENK